MARPPKKTVAFFPEILTITRKFSDEQFGMLMRAAFAYQIEGIVYSGDDAAVDVAFQLLADQYDRMKENAATNSQNAKGKGGKRNAAESSETKQNAAELSENKERKAEETESEPNPPPIQSVSNPYPILSNPDPNSIIVVAADNRITATAEQRLKLLRGELGKGVVALTDEQIDSLLEKLGLEMFDFYVDKLSAFIIKNNARVKNHYETILKWWREDSEAGQ